jgi:MoaA/NifB/PqqE/SkfB family radical SAM enzyme
MSLSDIEKLTKNIGPELMNVNITGGEPFYSQDIAEICELYIKNTSLDTFFFSTHGGATKRIEKFLDIVKKNLKTTFIFSISIDQIAQKHNDYRKVKNLFESAIETYNMLLKAGVNVRAMVSITVSEFNCDDIDEIFEVLTKDYNVLEITANIVRDEGVYTTPISAKERILKGYNNLVKKIEHLNNKQITKSYNFKTKAFMNMMMYKDSIMHKGIADAFITPKFQLPCYAGGGMMGVIYPNGDVFPCEVLEEKKWAIYLNLIWTFKNFGGTAVNSEIGLLSLSATVVTNVLGVIIYLHQKGITQSWQKLR